MKLLPTSLAAAAATGALAVLVALPLQSSGAPKPVQNAVNKPQQAAPKPAAKPPANKPAEPASEPAADPAAPADEDQAQALTARYARAAAVGDEHKWLAQLAGKWKTVTKTIIKAGIPPVESAGTSEFKLLMDGRFVIENNNSTGAPGPSQGMGIVGFNNVTQKYERVWFDTKSTAMMKSEGLFIKDRDEIRWVDQWCDPVLGMQTTHSTLRRLKDGKEFSFTQSVQGPNDRVDVVMSMQYRKD